MHSGHIFGGSIFMKKNRSTGLVILLIVVIVGGFLLQWELTAKGGLVDAKYVSYPSEILKDLGDYASSGKLWTDMGSTLKEAFLGLLFGTVIGVALAVLLGQFKFAGRVFNPIITALNSVPQLTLAPVYIMWFGLGATSKIFLASVMVFFCVFFSTLSAVQNMDRRLIEASTLLGASPKNILFKITLPACMPGILGGIRSGVGTCLVGAIIGEYMGATAGFGYMVSYAQQYFLIKRVLACVLMLLIIGVILNIVLNKVESIILKWHPQFANAPEKKKHMEKKEQAAA